MNAKQRERLLINLAARPWNSRQAMREILDGMAALGLIYHPDDHPSDIVWSVDMTPAALDAVETLHANLWDYFGRKAGAGEYDIYEETMNADVRVHGRASPFCPLHKAEFPVEYWPSDGEVQKIEADGFEDDSWRNDICPSWIKWLGDENAKADDRPSIKLWVDAPNPDDREFNTLKPGRFSVHYCPPGEWCDVSANGTQCETDDLDTALRAAEHCRLKVEACEQ